MSGRPKRKRNQKASGKKCDDDIINVDVDTETNDYEDDDMHHDSKSKKRSRQNVNDSDGVDDLTSNSSTPLLNTHLHSQLPTYLSHAFSDLYEQDGLVVLGRGLGWLGLLAAFVRYYGDTDAEDGYMADNNDNDEYNALDAKKMPVDVAYQSSTNEPHKKQKKKKLPLVFVLNLRETERETLLSTLTSWGTPPSQLPRILTNEESPAKERASLYAQGGVFLITSRILIVDLLNSTAKATDIDGMLVAHGDKVCGEKSMEAFILRIFRSQRYFSDNSLDHNHYGGSSKRGGFIKAFTDDPSSLVSGFAKVDKVLKSLQVQRLYLYPRFHSSVAEELEHNPPTVIELHQPLSESMNKIQNTCAAAIRACVRDIQTKERGQVDLSFLYDSNESNIGKKRKIEEKDALEFDFSYNYKKKGARKKGGMNGDDSNGEKWKITVQNTVSNNFGRILSRQLEGVWHTLGWDVKERVKDLRELSQLFHYLIEYDCVQFWRLLQGLKAMAAGNKQHGSWMLQGSGEELFRLAKARVYKLQETGKVDKNGEPDMKLKQTLEDKPKEVLLHQVMTEINNRWNAKQQKSASEKGKRGVQLPIASSNANVLLMVKDERQLRSVESYLRNGSGKREMARNFVNYLDQMIEKIKPMMRHQGGFKPETLPAEQRLLYEEHSAVRKLAFGHDTPTQFNKVLAVDRKKMSDWKKRHRRIIEEKTRGMATADTIHQQADLEEAVEESRGDLKAAAEPMLFQRIDTGDYSDGSEDSWSSDDDQEELAYKVEPIEGLQLFIRTFSKLGEGAASIMLNDIQPQYVVMYDSEPSFIRSLEIYSNSMKSQTAGAAKLEVFFLLYEATAEDINFSKALDREKDAFDKLIFHQKRMPTTMPLFNNFSTQEMQQALGGAGGSYAGGTLPLSMDTRTGGGKQKASKERRDIAVDVREFRSSLPSVLHQGGMRLAPAQLTVGDFILSNVHCVERKSLSDLYGSFNSGRLIVQAEEMQKYYKCPCLLIEFDSEKSFKLQNVNELGGEIRKDAISSKLTLLTMACPKLRILWSRSPHETLKIFKKLKRNHQEVDVDKAIEIGNNDTLDNLLLGGEDGYYNEDEEIDGSNDAGKAMLLRLPGVNTHNARKIMSECDSIAELAKLSREELRRIAGPVAGQKLFTFFGKRFEA